MTTNKPQYAISLTAEGLATGYLFKQGIPTPLSLPFVEASEADELGDGGVKVSGYGLAVWQWAFIELTARNILRTFCPDYSAEVYIRTLDQDNTWQDMKVIMLWPAKGETFVVDNSMALAINFKVLEIV